MRNFKRTLALVLAVIMVVGTFATVSAASTTAKWYDKAVEMLDNAGISNIGKGAAEPLSRNEFVMWIAKIESLQLSEDAWNDEIASVVFTDVTDAHHKAAIAYSYKANFIIGNGDGTFAPDKQLSLAEASAVIVRLMRYESKVTGLAEEWDMNYMRAAAIYCNAFDQTFYKNSNTFDPDYLLSKGETAYILATILNFVKDGSYNEIIKTADGIDLGARFEGMTPAAKENVYYITKLDRVSLGTSDVNSYIGGQKNPIFTNAIDTTANVTLMSADQTKTVVVPGTEFVKALRVSLGMAPTPDMMNEENQINVFEYVNVGTLVNVKLSDSVVFAGNTATITNYKELTGFAVNSNSVVVDTYLQLAAANRNAQYNNIISDGVSYTDVFYGYSIANKYDSTVNSTYEQWKPVLPASYDATMATSWTNITYDSTTGEVASATLNFKGVAYEYGSDIVAYDVNWVKMTADAAVKSLINAAQGECYAVFNDVDADGLYDTVYVKESHPFAYASDANVEPASSSTVSNILTSISNGKVMYANTALKNNAIGSVIFNKEVGYPNSGNISSSDSFNLTNKQTGKLQLILCASNAHPAGGFGVVGGYSHANDLPLYYTVVDLASFYTGIIQEVSANYVDGYYTARILCTDDIIRTVYIPVEASDSCELDVTVGGATATYTFNSTGWFTFLKDTQKAAEANGIAKPENQVDPTYTNWAASWMAGKYVEFSINENNEVICILGTDASTGTTGFVTGVEKTETGDNTYNVTLATMSGVKYLNDIVYFNAANPLTVAKLNAFKGSADFRNNSQKHKTDSIVAEDGKTYYKTGTKLWASTPTADATTYYVCIDEATGRIGINADGNYTDIKRGQAFVEELVYDQYNSVSGIATTEVRASASGIFDWANYNVYNQLFAGSLIDPNTTSDAKVDAGKDLIYVTLYKDAGSNYVLYNAYPEASAGVTTAVSRTSNSAYYFNPENYGGNFANRWYANERTTTYKAEYAWYGIEEGYFLSLEEIAGSRVPTQDKYGNENGYTARYNAKVGFGPYYDRAWNATTKTYTYDLKFTEVIEYQDFVGTATAIVDTTKTYMIPLYENQADDSSNQVIADTEAKKNYFTINNGYYVDDAGKVFILVSAGSFQTTVVYKTDANGKLVYNDVVYDYEKAVATVTVGNNVSFKDKTTLGLDKELTPYAILTLTAKTNKDEGYFPGAYFLDLDGETYNVNTNTKFVVVTPSADGFDIAVKTLAEMAAADPFFVTEWSAVIGTGNTIGAIAIVGEKATSGSSSAVDPEPPVDDKTTLVYLDADAKAFIRHDKYSNAWLVVSDKTAYALPTGEEVGAIYRSYPTYAEADNAIKIDLGIEGGKWYIVDENNKIVSSTDIKLLTGTVTDIKADGTTIATMNGVEKVVISTMKTEFFYFDAEGKTLNVAGDNTNVSVISKQAFADLFKAEVKAVEDAQNAYDDATVKYNNGNLSDDRYDYYKTNLENAQKALADAKANNLDKYFNGQFWGFANSPLYKYVAMAQGTFQEGKPTLTFNYVIVDDVLCVFSDSFTFGA